MLRALRQGGWSGYLFYTSGPGVWKHEAFEVESAARSQASPDVTHSEGVKRLQAEASQPVLGLQPAALPVSVVHATTAWKRRVNMPRSARANCVISRPSPTLLSPQQPVNRQTPVSRLVHVPRVQTFMPPRALQKR